MNKEQFILQAKLINNLRKQLHIKNKEIERLNDELFISKIKLSTQQKILNAYKTGNEYVREKDSNPEQVYNEFNCTVSIRV